MHPFRSACTLYQSFGPMPSSEQSPLCSDVFLPAAQKTSSARPLAPPLQIEPASPGFDLGSFDGKRRFCIATRTTSEQGLHRLLRLFIAKIIARPRRRASPLPHRPPLKPPCPIARGSAGRLFCLFLLFLWKSVLGRRGGGAGGKRRWRGTGAAGSETGERAGGGGAPRRQAQGDAKEPGGEDRPAPVPDGMPLPDAKARAGCQSARRCQAAGQAGGPGARRDQSMGTSRPWTSRRGSSSWLYVEQVESVKMGYCVVTEKSGDQ